MDLPFPGRKPIPQKIKAQRVDIASNETAARETLRDRFASGSDGFDELLKPSIHDQRRARTTSSCSLSHALQLKSFSTWRATKPLPIPLGRRWDNPRQSLAPGSSDRRFAQFSWISTFASNT